MNVEEMLYGIDQAIRLAQGGSALLYDPRFKKQSNFVVDNSRFLAACCTRRAGKSTGLAYRLFNAANKHPKSTPLYIGLTRDSAKSIMWPALIEMNDKYGWNAKFNEQQLTVAFHNGSRIRLVGADMTNFIRRLRGPKYPFVGIDEAQAFGHHLRELVDDVLTPAIADYADGAIALTGTPSPIPKGYFYDALNTDMGFSTHKWTIYDNPYMPGAAEFVADLMRRRGWDHSNPTYRREWLGEWVSDIAALVYKYGPERNRCYGLPNSKTEWHYVLGVDLGFSPDPSAFVLAAYSMTQAQMYILSAYKAPEMTISDVEDKIRKYLKDFPRAEVVIDAGGQGKQIVAELKQRMQLPLRPAIKPDKVGYIEMMNSDLLLGRIKVVTPDADALTTEWEVLPWAAEGSKKVEDPNMPNHCADAALYAWRFCFHYAWAPAEEKPKPHSEEAVDQWWEKEARALQKKKKKEFWEV